MFEIPVDLPLKLSSLAWLLGAWQGWGTIAAPGSMRGPQTDAVSEPSDLPMESADSSSSSSESDGEDEVTMLPVLQDLTAVIIGEQMRMTIRVFEGRLNGEFDPLWDAAEGLNRIEAGDLISEETTYWSVDTPLAVVPAGPDEPRELRIVGSSTRGFATLWAGVAMGPRVQMASDAVARAPRADALDYFSRMFGLVGGELMWASDSMVSGEEYSTEITGRLQRVASANEVAGASGWTAEPVARESEGDTDVDGVSSLRDVDGDV